MSSTTLKVTGQELDVLTGYTKKQSAYEAVEELGAQLSQPDSALVVVFLSPCYNLDEIGPLLKEKFSNCPVIGCTTSGEITPIGYSQNSMTGFSLSGKHSCVKTFLIDSLRDISVSKAESVGAAARDHIADFKKRHSSSSEFALFLVDGMSVAEEKTVALLHQALKNVPLVGGSAGDDLKFDQTWVLSNGKFHSNAAVFALVSTTLPFETFKTQHFKPVDTKMVITEADPVTRTIFEINGVAAADEYARLIGIKPDDLVPEVFSRYPIMLKIGNEFYVRSLQRKNPDGSLTFYCAIDNGLVLTFAKGVDLVENLRQKLHDITTRLSKPQLLISCECVLRRLEVMQDNITDQFNELLKANKAIGFHSYGEQINSIHVNQTFTGVMIGQKQ